LLQDGWRMTESILFSKANMPSSGKKAGSLGWFLRTRPSKLVSGLNEVLDILLS